MPFKSFPTCHCHSSASLDTASTAESFAAWEAEHETGALTITDHGTLAGARKVYDLATGKKYKGKLTPVLGLEAYFRDDNCPILTQFGVPRTTKYKHPKKVFYIDQEQWASKSEEDRREYTPFEGFTDYQKYFHLTMHFRDQQAYETAVRLLSFADQRAEKHGSEFKPLFGWKELEEIGSKNADFMSSCLIGMIQRHVAFGGRYDIAEAYYQKLRSCVAPGRFYVEVFPHVCDRNWSSKVTLTYQDGTTQDFPLYRNLKTDKKYGDREGIKAEKLAEMWERNREGHGALRAVMFDKKWREVEAPKLITDVKLFEGFIINECAPGTNNRDLQLPTNKFVIEMAKKYGDKILISDDSHFVHESDKIVQDVKLMQDGNWRFANSYHRMTSDEAWGYFNSVLGVEQKDFESWIENGREWVTNFKDFKFKSRPSLPKHFYPEDTLTHTMRLIQKHGRQAKLRDPRYFERLQKEIELLHDNGTIDLLPYFFIDEEVVDEYQRRGELTGPGRGSAAGLLLCWFLEITHTDPMKYGLLMERFLTKDRIESGKMPDIDQDLPHRDFLVDPTDSSKGWLTDRFGDCVVQISTDQSIRLRNGVLDVHRVLSPDRRVPEDVAALAHQFSKPPMGVSDRDHVFGYDNSGDPVPGAIEWDENLIEYTKRFPKEWEIVQKCLGITRGKSRHACAFVITDEPVYNFIPLTSVNGVKVTQPTAAQVESSGGLKMDFLIVNSLNDIGSAIKLIQGRSGDTSQPWKELGKSMTIGGLRVPLIRVVPHKGSYVDIWDLPEDQPVFRSICESDTESVFQLGSPGAIKLLRHFNHLKRVDASGEVHKSLDSIEDLAAFTALDRPGPLSAEVVDPNTGQAHNMLIEFARRARGEKPIGSKPILDKLFPETYGVMCYQEQLTKAFKEIGQTTAQEAEAFRVHVSKKQPMEMMKDKDIFMRGAVGSVGQQTAEELWDFMVGWGNYGFNKSHAVCYVVIGYACAWLKYHYPLEWWTAVLRNAKKNELDEKFWRHCGHLIDMPDISISGEQFEIINDRIRAPLNLLDGIGPAAHQEIQKYRPIASIEDLCQKIEARRTAEGKTETKMVAKKLKVKKGDLEVTELVPKTVLKKARTSLHSGVMSTLIASGAMDSLFPPDLGLLEKLELYFKTKCQVTGNFFKKTGLPKEKPAEKYVKLNALQRYQLRKSILPAYSDNLLGLVADQQLPDLKETPNGALKFRFGDEDLTVGRAGWLQHLETITPWPRGCEMRLATVAYVLSAEKKYAKKDGRERLQVTLDVEGTRWQLVRWPDRQTGKLPDYLNQDLKGSVVVAVLSKYTDEKPFTITDLIVIQPPLGDDEPEASPNPGDEE